MIRREQELERQLLHAQRMATVGYLTAGIAHDFNNLLTIILGYCDEATRLLGPLHPTQRMLEGIRSVADCAASLTRQLLAFGRQQTVERRALDINEAIADIARVIARFLGEDVELQFKPGPGIGFVAVDAAHLQQVIINLAVNARDAMPNGGRLLIETRNVSVKESRLESDRTVPPGEYVLLTVSDSGIGMSEATRLRLFEPFFTTKQLGRGTGLGLSTVRMILDHVGAFVCVDSEPGKGATFRIYLPTMTAGAPYTQADVVRTEPRGGNETLLLVEDDAAVRGLMLSYLARLGYRVLSAQNGTEALAVCGDESASPVLLITDVVMPDMNGYDLAERLTKQYPRLKVLYTSGHADDTFGDRIQSFGGHFQQKPFAMRAIARRIREVIDERSERY